MSENYPEQLEELPQYHFNRDVFCDSFERVYPNFLDDWDNFNEQHLDNFSLFRVEDEFYILHRASGTMINWYKHLGRTNTCNKDMDITGLDEFISLLKIDMEALVYRKQKISKSALTAMDEFSKESSLPLIDGITLTEFAENSRKMFEHIPKLAYNESGEIVSNPLLFNHSIEAPYLTSEEIALAIQIKELIQKHNKKE